MDRKMCCRIFPRKRLVVIEELGFMSFDQDNNGSTANRTDQQLLGPSEVARWPDVVH
jgi:hypothetical protein